MSDYTALISGYAWGTNSSLGRVVVTYSMPTSVPSYTASATGAPTAFIESFAAVTGTTADVAKQAIAIWEAAGNIQLVQVSSDANADMRFGVYDFSKDPNVSQYAGYAYYPSTSSLIGGDVFIDKGSVTDLGLWLHELGHALGLKHPFEGTITLDSSLDNTTNTVMSYTGYSRSVLGYLDEDAIRAIYTGTVDKNVIISKWEATNVTDSTVMAQITDISGTSLGGNSGWMYIGETDVQGDGDKELIMGNSEISRWAILGPNSDDLINFNNNGSGGDTRVTTFYIDPLIALGEVTAGSDVDSQRRFLNDLAIKNLNQVLGVGDYDGDGKREIYFKTTDKTAYLHAILDGDYNLQYANYQSADQMKAYLDSHGVSGYSDWLLA